MSAKLTGGCACGAVRYEISAAPVVSAQCQCRDCQRATGTGHVDAMVFPRNAIAVTGDLKFHDRKGDSGHTVSRGFCPNCGAPVLWRFARNPDVCGILAGSMDDASGFAPQLVTYTSRGYAWDMLDPAVTKFDKMPPG